MSTVDEDTLSRPAAEPGISVAPKLIHHTPHGGTGRKYERVPPICIIKGDPHIMQFDTDRAVPGGKVFLTSSCMFTLVQDGCENGSKTTFQIVGTFSRVKDLATPRSYVRDVFISLSGGSIQLYQDLKVKVGVIPVQLPGTAHGAFISKVPVETTADWPQGTTEVVSVKLANGVEVQWDGIKTVHIHLPKPEEFVGVVCGLCGNADGDPSNDLAQGYHTRGKMRAITTCPNKLASGPPHSQAQDEEDFGNSWFWGKIIENYGGFCDEECGSYKF